MISGIENDSKKPSVNFLEKFYETFDIGIKDKARIDNTRSLERHPQVFSLKFFNWKKN